MEEIKKLRFQKPDENGWEWDYDFIQRICELVSDAGEEEVSMEQVHAMLIALCNIA